MKLHSYAAAMEEKFKTEETCGRLQWRQPEVEFVHPVSAGGSVKFLPAV